jgi:SAM-dependent methyltransferase
MRFKNKIEQFNRVLPLNDYFLPLIGDRKEVSILDVGSGPYPITGQTLEGVKVNLRHCDNRGFDNFWANNETVPLFKIEVLDMENLDIEDNSYDIVHCVNALDHTRDALKAVKELIRVSREWVYIDCSLNQHSVRGKKHYWDAKEDGTFINETGHFNLKDLGFSIKYIDKGGEPQYNQIIATLQK